MSLTRRGDTLVKVCGVLLAIVLVGLIVHTANNTGKKALVPSNSSKPLGVRLQEQAGDGFEVIYNSTTGVYTVEPKGRAGITTK